MISEGTLRFDDYHLMEKIHFNSRHLRHPYSIKQPILLK